MTASLYFFLLAMWLPEVSHGGLVDLGGSTFFMGIATVAWLRGH